MSATLALQKHIYAQIVTAFSPSIVYVGAPVGLALSRYVDIQEVINSDNFDGEDLSRTLHIWSDQGGTQEVAADMQTIRGLLHDKSATVDGYRLTCIRVTSSDIFRDSNGISWHGVMEISCYADLA
jgi:hypothetical protein